MRGWYFSINADCCDSVAYCGCHNMEQVQSTRKL